MIERVRSRDRSRRLADRGEIENVVCIRSAECKDTTVGATTCVVTCVKGACIDGFRGAVSRDRAPADDVFVGSRGLRRRSVGILQRKDGCICCVTGSERPGGPVVENGGVVGPSDGLPA